MFSKSKIAERVPLIEVINVTQIKGDKVSLVVTYNHFQPSEKEVKGEPYTIVLYTSDGDLKTKKFPGTWTLQDCKKWNPSSWLAS